jgi:16S rRNA G966 N2-methylase RsmD
MSDRLFEPSDSLFADPQNARTADQAAVVEAMREELRRRLPELRKLPGFPHGTDEDILAMSYPPYYTACPNPFIADWLAGLDRPSDEGRVDPGPFASDISEGKGNTFYKAHSYPTKVPHPAIMRFILHYTKPGDVVLDGFAGSGMTGVAAQACGSPDPKVRAAIEAEFGAGNIEWGSRRAILSDLGPSATFIEAGLNLPISAKGFDKASKGLLDRFDSEYGWMYRTTVTPDSGEPFEADIDYVIWSEVFACPHCGGEVIFYDAAFNRQTLKVRDAFQCTSCGAQLNKRAREVRKQKHRTLAGDIQDRVEMRPVSIVWRSGALTGEKRVDEADIRILDRVSAVKVQGFPTNALPNMHMTHERNNLPQWGISALHHFWQDRPLVTLAILWSWTELEPNADTRIALRFWVEQAFWGLSWMNRYVPTHYSQVNSQMTGVYYIPSLMSECSPRYNLDRSKRNGLISLWSSSPASFGNSMISTGSSTKLLVPDSSVDYVFVDPPFGENIYYSDLAFLVEAWHRVTTSSSEEAIESRHKQSPKTLDTYADLMTRCFMEFYRVLKPGRWMTVEFSNHSNDVWLRIQNALAAAGFVVADTRVIDKEQLSYRQVTAQNAVKHDLVISAYKPAEATEQSFEIAAGSADGAWTFVREHLSRIPATERTKDKSEDGSKALVVRERQADRIYERMVGYHVARNTVVPMTAAEFYTGLEQRFPIRDGMYFLPDQVEEYERFRITFKELARLELLIHNESTAVQWLRQTLKDRPRAFADIQPLFMREMQSSVASWEAMPDLKEMLEGNFVSDGKGRWSVPDPKKAEHLDQLRTRALLKEFESYTSSRGPLNRFRTEAVRAGFKAAWAAKDYATISAVGKRLPNDVFIEDSALLHYFRNAERLAQ